MKIFGREAVNEATNAPCAIVSALMRPKPPLSIGHLARSNCKSAIVSTPAIDHTAFRCRAEYAAVRGADWDGSRPRHRCVMDASIHCRAKSSWIWLS